MHTPKSPPGSRDAQKAVGLCRTSKMHSDRSRRLTVAMKGHPDFELLMINLIERVEGQASWSGPRPAGWLEDQAQRLTKKPEP